MLKTTLTFAGLKRGYWVYRFHARPFAFVLDKACVCLLLFSLVIQLLSGRPDPSTFPFRVNFHSWVLVCSISVICNFIQLLYFPSLLDKMIGVHFFHLYPLSRTQLNAVRHAESFFSKTYLLTCNMLYLPTLLLHQNVHGPFVFALATLLLVRVLCFLLYDLFRLLADRYFYALLVLIFCGLWMVNDLPAIRHSPHWPWVQRAIDNNYICCSAILLFFFIDTQLLGLRSRPQKQSANG
jgi:hypothetical protein